ncbi:DUF4160 domain-containing protein [Leptolyngbya subtilissima]
MAKFWLSPVTFEKNRGFKDYELNKIAEIVEENQDIL